MDQFFRLLAIHVGETTNDNTVLLHNVHVVWRGCFVCLVLILQFDNAFLEFLACFLFLPPFLLQPVNAASDFACNFFLNGSHFLPQHHPQSRDCSWTAFNFLGFRRAIDALPLLRVLLPCCSLHDLGFLRYELS